MHREIREADEVKRMALKYFIFYFEFFIGESGGT